VKIQAVDFNIVFTYDMTEIIDGTCVCSIRFVFDRRLPLDWLVYRLTGPGFDSHNSANELVALG